MHAITAEYDSDCFVPPCCQISLVLSDCKCVHAISDWVWRLALQYQDGLVSMLIQMTVYISSPQLSCCVQRVAS